MRRALLLVALAAGPLLGAPVPAFAQSNPEGERLVEMGRRAFDAGDYMRAAQYLWDASLADEAVRDSAPLQILRGRAVMRTGRPENAIRIFDLIGGDPLHYADALYWRGEALLMMTDPEEAAAAFRRALEFDPDHRMARDRLSFLPAQMDAADGPEPELVDSIPTEIIAAEPTRPARARDESATAGQDGPTRLGPQDAPASPPPGAPAPDADAPQADAAAGAAEDDLALGRAAFDSGDYQDAAARLWRATLADSAVRADAEIQTLRARAVMESGRPEAAVRAFDAILEIARGAEGAEAAYWRGEAQRALGQNAAAERSFRLALNHDPAHEGAQERLGPALAAEAAAAAPAPEAEGPVIRAEAAPAAPPAPTPSPAQPDPAPAAAQPAPPPAASSAPPGAAELDAFAAQFRAEAEASREAGDRRGEANALSELYLTQRADPAEIARYAELAAALPSSDIGRDAQIAQLAGYGGHFDLSVALFRAVENSGAIQGRNLSILRGNLATTLLEAGDAAAALETADAAIEADEDYANAWGVRSLARQEMGDVGGALEDAITAYDLGATAPPVLALLRNAGLEVAVPQIVTLDPSEQDSPAGLRGALE